MFQSIKVVMFQDGIMFGFTYYGPGDRSPEFEHELWNEFNIYILIFKITFKW